MKKSRIGVEQLWKIKRPAALALSPDGERLVCSLTSYSMRQNQGRASLWMLSSNGARPRLLTTCGDKDGQPAWSPDGQTIAFVARREWQGQKDETPQLYLIHADGGEARRLTHLATGVAGIKWFPDSRRLAFISWVWPDLRGAAAQARRLKQRKADPVKAHRIEHTLYRHWDHWLSDGRVPHLYMVDLAGGRCRDLFEGTSYELECMDPDQHSYDLSPDGRRIAFAYDPLPDKRIDAEFHLAELQLSPRRFHALTLGQARRDYRSPRYSPDGSQIACLSANVRRNPAAPQEITLVERANGRAAVVSGSWDRSVETPLRWNEDGTALLCLAQDQGRQHLYRYELPARRATRLVSGGMVTEFDCAADCVAFVRDTLQAPSAIWARRGNAPERKIESFNDALLRRLELGKSEEVRFRGWGGDTVQMWLVFPPGFDARKKYPLLHSIHGGPHAISGDSWHFRWNSQLFAAQGYIVAAVNYHGSTSFGRRFTESIHREWGKRELADIEAGTALLRRRRYVDAQRLFASGGSYGGYLVAWMNGHLRPGRYRAYVCHAGCFDWVSMFADDGYTFFAKELGAWYWQNPARIEAQNPRAAVRRMATPTLVIHGALDYRVPDTQALQYYNTLRAKQVPTRLVYFPDENHWILKPQNSRLWHREFFAWLRRFDRGAPQSAKRSIKP